MPQSIADFTQIAPSNGDGVFGDQLTAWELTRRMSPRDDVHVMKRDAYGRLDVNNYPLIHRVGPIEPTTPWTIYLTDCMHRYRFVPFDFDGKNDDGPDPDLMDQAQDQCDALSQILDELGIRHVVCESSGTGGRHIWIAIRGGADKDVVAAIVAAAKANYRQLDTAPTANWSTGAMRPPLSPHRDGSFSTVIKGDLSDLLFPSTTTADLEALAGRLNEHAPVLIAQESRPSGPVDPSHKTHRPLSPAGVAHMATIGGGSDPSKTGFLCLLSAANANWTFLDVEHAAKTAPGMEHYRSKKQDGGRRPRSAADTRSRLARGWDRAVRYASVERLIPAQKEPEDLTELNTIVTAVEDLMMRFRVNPGRWGASEATSNHQSILRALAFLTLHAGKSVVAASTRDLGLISGLGKTTACTALRALAEAGYIQLVTGSVEGNAAEWRLASTLSTPPSTVRSHLLNNAPPPPADRPISSRNPAELFNARAILVDELEAQLIDQRHDLFTRRGLGHLAGKVYALLGKHAALSIETAAKLLGVSTRHAATILSRLRTHKLIVSHRDGWARSKRDLRDKAAEAINVSGALVTRAECYRVDREVWAWWRSELATMNASPRKRPRRPHVSSRPLFDANSPGERVWPRYPRSSDGRADHRAARELVVGGFLSPESRWQYYGDAVA